MKLVLRTVFACLIFGMTSHFAKAAIIINFDQSASGSLGTVDLPGGATGLLIQGTADGGALLNFTGSESLISPSNGQARIEGVDGAFQTLDIRFALGYLFDRIVFNLNASADGSVTVQAINQANVIAATQVLALTGAGENFINVDANAGDLIRAVIITTTVGLEDIRQVRVGGIDTGTGSNAVPEPSTFAMVGAGLLGLGMLSKRIQQR